MTNTFQHTLKGSETTAFEYIVETSSDMRTWHPAPVTAIDSCPLAPGYNAVTLRFNQSPANRRYFLRIRVEGK